MIVSDVNIQPNRTGLPGIASLESIVGALLTFGLVAAVAGIAISAMALGDRVALGQSACGRQGQVRGAGGAWRGILDRWRHVPGQLRKC
jgi:Family of unknown function (DUF6112)